jgi:hypothetical protein
MAMSSARTPRALHHFCHAPRTAQSLVLITTLAFREWPTIFPNAACTTALIDRVVHHAEIIAIEGDSYRRREAQAEKPSRRAKTKP